MTRKASSIEVAIKDLLVTRNIGFKKEYAVGNYPVDFYIPKFNLSIQVDGAYYHGPCWRCDKGSKPSSRQLFQSRRDEACVVFHQHIKVNIVRVCECLINSDMVKVEEILYNAVEDIKEGKEVYLNKI